MLATTGCGSSVPAPTKAPVASASSAGAPAPAPAPAPTAKQKSSLEAQRGPFIDACMGGIGSKEYCECGFVQFAALFRDADFEQAPSENDPRMQQLALNMRESCADKFPEPKAQEQFEHSCTGDKPARQPYCGCAWTELRKTLSVSEILDYPPGGTKFAEARAGIPKACQGKYPAELAANEYFSACKNSGQKTQKQCECMWKKVLKKYTVEQLAAGVGDPTKILDLDKCK